MATLSTDFGSCWSCVDDLVMPSTMATGFRVVGEAIARRWNTPTGGLIDDPDYGFDLSEYVSDDIVNSDLTQIAHFAAAEAEKDERVLSCEVEVDLSASNVLTVTGRVETSTGPFQLVVTVDQVSVTLLSVTGVQ